MSTLIKTVLSFLSLFIVISSRAQAPTANFTAANVQGCSPMIVNFQDLSTGNPTSWTWDFGNGATSNFKNPSTTYFTPGVYTVKLTVKNAAGQNTLVRTSYITVFGKPTVSFGVTDSSGCFPVYSMFMSTSTASPGTVNNNFFWDFGDGVQSTLASPGHSYTTAGNFTVTLKVTNDKGCWSVLSKPAYINVTSGVKTLFSNTNPQVCKPPFPVSFTNGSTGPGTLSYQWNFGDGNTSILPNPTHTYTAPGNYTVSLITNSTDGCSDTLTKTNLFTFLDINPSITGPDSVCIDEEETFYNTTTPSANSMSWNFDDGTSSLQLNPIKSWSTPGTYNVRLINYYSYCTDSINKTVVVSPKPTANFTTLDSFKCSPPFTVNFQNQSVSGVSYLWDFGDGTSSNATNPSHTYTSFGTYTVTLISFNSAGCTDTVVRTNVVRVVKPVITVPSLPDQGCIPYGIDFIANVATEDQVTSYSWNFGDGSPISTLPTPSHMYTTQGIYEVTVTITTSTGCTETLVIPNAVTVGTRPVINFTAAPNPVCAFTNVQFINQSDIGNSFVWKFGDGQVSNLVNPIHQYEDTGLFNVTLLVYNNGCLDSLTKPNYIRIKPPIAKFGFVADCNNRLLFNFKDSSLGANTWFWNFGDGNTSNAQNPVHTYATYGFYDVTLTVTNDTCSNTITKTIRVFNENPDFVGQNIACRVANINYSATNLNYSNIVNYTWNFGNGPDFNSLSQHVTGTYPLSGTYTVSLVTTDIYGCRDTIQKINYLRVNGPTASFSATNTSGCIGLVTTFTDLSTSDGTSNIVNWRWDYGDGTVQNYTGPPFQHTYNTVGNFSVKLTVTDAGGCMDSVTWNNVIYTSDPKANFITADTLACPGSTVTFQNNTTGYAYTSFWTFGDGDTLTQHTPSHVYTNTGLYTVSLHIIDGYGCHDSITKVNYIKVENPVASYTVSDSISSCIPFEVNFVNTSQYEIQAIWELGTGISTQISPTVYYVNPGVYNTFLAVMSPGGCRDTMFKTITVYDTIGTYLRYQPLGGCKPLPVDLQSFTKGPMTYTWDFGDGLLINSDSPNISHIYDIFGNFVPKIIMTDPSGCIIPVTGPDTIRVIGAIAKFGLDSSFFCDSGLVSFLDSTTYNDSILSYTWNFGDGTFTNIHPPPSHFYASPGLYTVGLSVVTQNNCLDTFQLQNVVKVVESPLVTIGGDSVICVNELMTHLGVFQRPDTSVVNWKWTFPNGNSSDVQDPLQQKYPVAGNFDVLTIATNSSGCRDTAVKNILVNPLPQVTMPSSINKQAGFPVTIPATYTSNVTNWLWTPDATLSCPNCPQPVATPKFNTRYTVSFVDSNGCKNYGSIQVIVFCENANVFVPNTFSPNGDGSNDVFYVRGKGLERVKTLRVFNRWGEVVFEKNNFNVNDASAGWDGRYKGNQAVPDVYVYQVEVFCENSDIIKFEGNVALIK